MYVVQVPDKLLHKLPHEIYSVMRDVTAKINWIEQQAKEQDAAVREEVEAYLQQIKTWFNNIVRDETRYYHTDLLAYELYEIENELDVLLAMLDTNEEEREEDYP